VFGTTAFKPEACSPPDGKLLNTDILVQELPKMGTWWFPIYVLCEWILIFLNFQIIQFSLRSYFFRNLDISRIYYSNQSAPYSKFKSRNCTVFNILGLSSDRYLLFWIFRRPFNRSSPSPVKQLIRGTLSAAYTSSPNQLTNRPLATKFSVDPLLNVLMCNLKFFTKTLCSPSLLR